MKQVRYKLLLLAGAIGLVSNLCGSCTEDVSTEESSRTITFTVDDSVFKEIATRGTPKTSATIGTFGVCAAIYPAASSFTSVGCGSYFYNKEVDVATGNSHFFYPGSSYRLAFYAHYPFNNAALTASSSGTLGYPVYSYTVPANISNQLDFMTATVVNRSGAVTNEPVALSFKHRCADIRFSVRNQGETAITIHSIGLYGLKYSGTFTNETWSLGAAVNSNASHPFLLTLDTSIAGGATVDITGTTNHFIMLPQTIAAGTQLIDIDATIDGERRHYYHTLETAQTWAMAKSYTYSITLGIGAMIVDPLSDIQDWTLQTDRSGLPVYQYPTTTTASVKGWKEDGLSIDLGLPSGTLWARGNIVSDGAGGYKIGKNTDYGAYFSWGNIDPHFSTNGSTFDDGYNWGTTNNGSPYSGTTGKKISFTSRTLGRNYPANTTNDAARACLGDSWQVPTATQFKELYDNTDNEWTTIGSVDGRKFMKRTDHSIYVFFPAAGYGTSASLNSRGTNGFYWSSSLYDSGYAYYLNFKNSSVSPQSYSYRYFGMPVRPVEVE